MYFGFKSEKGKSAKVPLIIGFVLGVLAAIGMFAQASAGGSFDLTDILSLAVYFIVMVVGVIVVKSKGSRTQE